VAPPPASEVATLTDSVDAKWRGANTSFKHGTRLSTRREPLVLDKGFAEILFDNQARIVIEAPAQFEIATQDQVNLMYGRVYASVPKEALGFTIYTQNSKIIDLGTEFGVDTAMDGTVELHVIKGQTMLIAGGRAEKTMHTVAKGKAWRISGITAIRIILFAGLIPITMKYGKGRRWSAWVTWLWAATVLEPPAMRMPTLIRSPARKVIFHTGIIIRRPTRIRK
jgi:hypothetical protein